MLSSIYFCNSGTPRAIFAYTSLYLITAAPFWFLIIKFHFKILFCASSLVIMDKMDAIPVKLTGKNYKTWSFHLKNYVEGKGMLGYLDGTITKPTAVQDEDSTSTASKYADDKAMVTWNQNNAKVGTRILNSVDPSLYKLLQRPLLCGPI